MPWGDFPDVVLHAEERVVKKHPLYAAAKSGDADAAVELVNATISNAALLPLTGLSVSAAPTLVSAHAFEAQDINAIPEILADVLGGALGWPVNPDIVQSNVVGHTGSDGFHRLANQAAFTGMVVAGNSHVLVDDFVGQGGTLANLRGYVEASGGE